MFLLKYFSHKNSKDSLINKINNSCYDDKNAYYLILERLI